MANISITNKLISHLIRFASEASKQPVVRVLAPALAAEYARQQNEHLISAIDRRSGTGTPPATGGKVELRNRGKMKYDRDL